MVGLVIVVVVVVVILVFAWMLKVGLARAKEQDPRLAAQLQDALSKGIGMVKDVAVRTTEDEVDEMLTAPGAETAAKAGLPAPDEGARQGLRDLRRKDPAFDLDAVLRQAEEVFLVISEAWAKGDPAALGDNVPPSFVEQFNEGLAFWTPADTETPVAELLTGGRPVVVQHRDVVEASIEPDAAESSDRITVGFLAMGARPCRPYEPHRSENLHLLNRRQESHEDMLRPFRQDLTLRRRAVGRRWRFSSLDRPERQ